MSTLQKEWKSLWQGRFPQALFYLVPIVLCLMFGAVYSCNTVRHIPTVILDQSQSSLSRNYIRLYDDSERFDIIAYADSSEEMEAMLKNSTAYAAISIPKDFGKNIKTGSAGEAALIVNSANNLIGNSALSSMREINKSFSAAVSTQLLESVGILPAHAREMVYPVHIGTRLLNNPANGYTPFMLPGLILNALQVTMLITIAPLFLKSLEQREYSGNFPCLAGKLYAKILPHILLGMLSFFTALSIACLLFDIYIKGSLFLLALLLLAYLIAVTGILCLFSSLSPTPVLALQIPLLYIMPGLLFSGLSWPTLSMTGFAAFYSAIMPMSYTADTMRDILTGGYAPSLLHDCIVLLLMGIISFILACCIYKLRLHYMHKKAAEPEEMPCI